LRPVGPKVHLHRIGENVDAAQQARRFNDLVMSGKGATITELAATVGVSSSYFTRVFPLSFLAPEITRTILLGRQPLELTANTLIRAGRHRQLGLGDPPVPPTPPEERSAQLPSCSLRYHAKADRRLLRRRP